MGLDEFRAATAAGEQQSKIDVICESVGAERAKDLREALADRTISGAAIVRVLRSWGHPITVSSVKRYRERVA